MTNPNQHPPGEHVEFPEVQWPAATSEPPVLLNTDKAPPLRASIVASVERLPEGNPASVGLLDYILWALCAAAFVLLLVLASDGGPLLGLVQ